MHQNTRRSSSHERLPPQRNAWTRAREVAWPPSSQECYAKPAGSQACSATPTGTPSGSVDCDFPEVRPPRRIDTEYAGPAVRCFEGVDVSFGQRVLSVRFNSHRRRQLLLLAEDILRARALLSRVLLAYLWRSNLTCISTACEGELPLLHCLWK